MAEIIEKFKKASEAGTWFLILECGHWFKWFSGSRPPKKGKSMRCPVCASKWQ